jgi:hypothetical protein
VFEPVDPDSGPNAHQDDQDVACALGAVIAAGGCPVLSPPNDDPYGRRDCSTAPITASTGDGWSILTVTANALTPDPVDPFAGIESDALVESARALAALEAGVRVQQLQMLAALDAREVWREDGQTHATPWVCLVLGVTRRTARDLLAVARVLDTLPAVIGAYTNGTLSWDQVVWVVQLADAETDADWAAEGPRHCAEDLAAMVRNRRISDDEARDAHDRRELRFRPERGGTTRLSGRLPNDAAERVRVTLENLAAATTVADPDTGTYPTTAQRHADALVELCRREDTQASSPDTTRPATVVVHADLGLLTGETPDGHATLTDGTPIAAATLRRLVCDARIEWAVDDPRGRTLGIGRASRNWPPWLARLIRRRDGNRCRFPGCTNPIHEIHHQQEWEHGGHTCDINAAGMCGAHHHIVHEGGWTITGDPNAELTFTSPTGRTLTSHPPNLTPELRTRIDRALTTLTTDLF